MVSFDPKSDQPPVVNAPEDPKGSTGFAGPIPADMRFASDHGTLAPHQLPELPSAQTPSSIKPDLFTSAQTKRVDPKQPTGQQINLTFNPNTNQPNIQTAPIQQTQTQTQTTQQPMVQINVQAPTAPVTPTPVTPIENKDTTQSVGTVGVARAPRKAEVLRWLVIFGLAGIGMKGLFDSLYFIFVEFQNFEKALEDHLIETAQVNPLILKAALLIFATAVCVFFGMQLTMTKSKNLRLFRILGFVIVGIACAAVLQYASTINVLDSFKSP